jgi:hypothetical protein
VDTFDVSQAFAVVRDWRDPRTGARLQLYADDSELLLDPYVTFKLNGTPTRCLLSRATSSVGYWTPTVIGLVPPTSPTPELLVILSDDHRGVYYVTDNPDSKSYMARDRSVGTHYSINLSRFSTNQGDIVSGSFSGTLGWWAFGHNSDSVPPDETIDMAEGVFKVVWEDATAALHQPMMQNVSHFSNQNRVKK